MIKHFHEEVSDFISLSKKALKALVETQYLPPISFFQKGLQYGHLNIEAHEHYQKRSYRNRCFIAGPNGLQRLSIPLVKGKNTRQNIKDVKIASSENWQKQHWQSIQTAYGKSPFFEYYVDEIAPLFEKPKTFLYDWNWMIINQIKEILQLNFEISETCEYLERPKDDQIDFRNKETPVNRESQSAAFSNYPQVFEAKNGFLYNLSILDLIFCTGPEALIYLEQT